MAKLPDANELGALPSLQSRRPIASYDDSSIAKAGEAVGEAIAKGGRVIGEGLSDLGKGMGNAGAGILEYRKTQDELELANKKAEKLTLQAQAENDLAEDKDFSTMRDRYGKRIEEINSSISEGISSPNVRGRFEQWNAPRDVYFAGKVSSTANKLEGDYQVANTADKLSGLRQAGLTSADPVAREDIIRTGNDQITNLEKGNWIDASKAMDWRRRWAVDYATSSYEIMPPEARIAALEDKTPGKLVSFIPEDKRVAMLERAKNQALADKNKSDSQGALDRYATKRAVDDDVSSILATGQGGDETAIKARITNSFGPKAVKEWQDNRSEASATWAGSHDLYSLSDDQIDARLEAIRPKAGQDNFDRRHNVFEAVQKNADKVRKQRVDDPAGSVNEDPGVRAATASGDPKDPDTAKAVIAARMAAQERADIPQESRSPITKQEALALSAPLRRMLPGQERQTLTMMAEDFKTRFGSDADLAFQYALRVHKVDTETAQAAARVMRKLGLGQVPEYDDARAVDQASERDAATRAVTATAPQPFTIGIEGMPLDRQGPTPAPQPAAPAKPIPPAADVKALLANPNLADRFEAKWGKGSAKKLLETYTVR